ncbi:MAG: FG-GAP repeat domain-containing protein, partial [Thermoanaerobaculia bacterium]
MSCQTGKWIGVEQPPRFDCHVHRAASMGRLRVAILALLLAVIATPRASWAACPDFAAAVNYGAGTGTYAVAIGDFNRDGKADIAVANATSNDVSILLGNGNGTFAAPVNYPAGTYPESVAIGDFNSDGKADLAVANSSSDNVSILLGNGNGTFTAAVNYGAGSDPRSL